MANILKPLKTSKLNLSNRLVMPPMATYTGEHDGKVSQSILDYYDEKTRGGYISLVIVEHSFIQANGKAGEKQISVADEGDIEGLKRLAQVIQRNGSKAVLQINHAGSAAREEIIGTIPVAPSEVSNRRTGKMPRELTLEEIGKIIESFKNAARRTKEAGFDGVEIHSAHGYLLNQFYSPLTNKRTDEYGGSIQNRIRIHLQIIKAIRAQVGDEYPLLLRLGASDYTEGGTTIDDSKIAAQDFEKAGVDILDISGGYLGAEIPGVDVEGYFAPLSEEIKKVVSIPVIVTGGITKVQTAEQILEEKKADLIGVGKAILKDSNWAKKAIESLK